MVWWAILNRVPDLLYKGQTNEKAQTERSKSVFYAMADVIGRDEGTIHETPRDGSWSSSVPG
jgi:hypothetical protein